MAPFPRFALPASCYLFTTQQLFFLLQAHVRRRKSSRAPAETTAAGKSDGRDVCPTLQAAPTHDPCLCGHPRVPGTWGPKEMQPGRKGKLPQPWLQCPPPTPTHRDFQPRNCWTRNGNRTSETLWVGSLFEGGGVSLPPSCNLPVRAGEFPNSPRRDQSGGRACKAGIRWKHQRGSEPNTAGMRNDVRRAARAGGSFVTGNAKALWIPSGNLPGRGRIRRGRIRTKGSSPPGESAFPKSAPAEITAAGKSEGQDVCL